MKQWRITNKSSGMLYLPQYKVELSPGGEYSAAEKPEYNTKLLVGMRQVSIQEVNVKKFRPALEPTSEPASSKPEEDKKSKGKTKDKSLED